MQSYNANNRLTGGSTVAGEKYREAIGCAPRSVPKKDFWVNGKIQQRGQTKGVDGEWRDRSRKWLFVKRWDVKSEQIVRPSGSGGGYAD